MTGQPDFYDLTLSYRPGEQLLESKVLKPYLWGFKERGIFEDFVAASTPAEYEVDLTQRVRGGLEIRTVARHSI